MGSVSGEPGESLKVRVQGDKSGVWADFAGDDKGDLLDLIVAVRHVNIAEAIKIAKEYLGLKDPESVVPRKKYSKPSPKGVKKLTSESAVMDYLKNARMLNEDTIKMFRVSDSNNGTEIAFPSYSREMELVNVKYIGIELDERGKKVVRQESGCAPILFGWQAFPSNAREAVICEGHIDAMTWRQAGFNALSVPDGVANSNWIELEWDNLQQFDTIWLAYDNDEAGNKITPTVALRLGLHRCLVVKIDGFKDANDALQAGADPSVLISAIAHAKPISPEQIKTPVDFRNRVVEKFHPPGGTPPGFFPVLLEKKYGARPGEVTVWTGISGHGKSIMLSQLMIEALHCGEKVAIGSFEMRGEQTLHRMITQSELNTAPSVAEIDKVLSWMSGKLWIYDIIGNIAPTRIFELMEYSRCRHGVTQFVLDSLMKCSVGSEDYDAQRVFLNNLCSFAKEHECHIHLVAHARKGRDEKEAPGKMDVKGSGDIINQADNIICVWRNKEKEHKRANTGMTDQEDLYTPDAITYCTKQRETGVEFECKHQFFKKVFRFHPTGLNSNPRDMSILKAIKSGSSPVFSNAIIDDDQP